MKTPEQMAEEWATEATRQYIEPYDTWSAEEYAHVYYGFLAGYQAAKEQLQPQPFHAGADVYIIDANNPLPKPMPLSIAEQDQLADTCKVMNSSNNSNGWISVKERLPDPNVAVLAFIIESVGDRKINEMEVVTYRSRVWLSISTYYSKEAVTHWMPLPEAPKREK